MGAWEHGTGGVATAGPGTGGLGVDDEDFLDFFMITASREGGAAELDNSRRRRRGV